MDFNANVVGGTGELNGRTWHPTTLSRLESHSRLRSSFKQNLRPTVITSFLCCTRHEKPHLLSACKDVLLNLHLIFYFSGQIKFPRPFDAFNDMADAPVESKNGHPDHCFTKPDNKCNGAEEPTTTKAYEQESTPYKLPRSFVVGDASVESKSEHPEEPKKKCDCIRMYPCDCLDDAEEAEPVESVDAPII
uniref:Uncharacterized protein n=1 Tax=Steinernema glaseri TaxID=37863 RepID=A0A1I8A0X8_9BILA